MPTYTPPNFNAHADRWIAPNTPASSPPDITNQLFQIYLYGRTPKMWLHKESGLYLPLIIFREPIAASTHGAVNDILRPTGSAVDTYKIIFVQVMHLGFPNQYVALFTVQCNANGTIPRTPVPSA